MLQLSIYLTYTQYSLGGSNVSLYNFELCILWRTVDDDDLQYVQHIFEGSRSVQQV